MGCLKLNNDNHAEVCDARKVSYIFCFRAQKNAVLYFSDCFMARKQVLYLYPLVCSQYIALQQHKNWLYQMV